MYQYAILNENNICHTVYETNEERNDFDQKVIPIEIYDINENVWKMADKMGSKRGLHSSILRSN